MTVEELLIYFLIVMTGTLVGIPLGSWLNSKLLTRTLKSDILKTLQDSKKSPEYGMVVELLTNANEALKSPEAKNLFTNLNNLINEARTMLTKPPNNTKSLLTLPKIEPYKSSPLGAVHQDEKGDLWVGEHNISAEARELPKNPSEKE